MVGSMFAFSDVLTQTASLVGTYGLSFLLLLMTGACYAAFKKHYKSALFVVLSILGMMIVFGVWRLKSNGIDYSSIKIRIVQPSIAQSLKWDRQSLDDNLKTYIDMSRNTGMQDVKMIVWGETATAFNPEESIYYKNLIKQAIPENGYLITGLIRYDEKTDKLYNSVSVIDQKGQTVSFYDKNHLVPFGEYIPFRKYLPAWVRPIANHIADFSKGEKFKILHVDGLPPFGALVCYEVIFPDQIVNRNNKPQFIVLVSNDGWYGQSFGPYQHFVAAKLRAVEEGVTIIRSANNGMSGLIDPLGRVFGKINLNVKGVRDVYLPAVLSVFSLYSLIGGIGVQCVMLLILLMMLYQNKHKINQ
jgi:apolipoprotein N-acyltransferase